MFYTLIDGKKRRVYRSGDSYYMYVTKRKKHAVESDDIFEADPIPRRKTIPLELKRVQEQNIKLESIIAKLRDQLTQKEQECIERLSTSRMPDDDNFYDEPEIESKFLESSTEELDEYKLQIQELNAQLETLRAREQELLNQLATAGADTRLPTCLGQLEECTTQKDSLQHQLDTVRAEFLSRHDTDKLLIINLQSSLEDAKNINTRMQVDIGEKIKQAVLDEKGKCKEQLDKAVAEYVSEIRHIQSELEKRTKDLYICESKNRESALLDSELTQYKLDLAACEARQEDCNILQQKHDDLHKQKEFIESRLNDSEERCNRRVENIKDQEDSKCRDKIMQAIQQDIEAIEKLTSINQELEDRNTALDVENKKLKAELKENEKAISKMADEIEQIEQLQRSTQLIPKSQYDMLNDRYLELNSDYELLNSDFKRYREKSVNEQKQLKRTYDDALKQLHAEFTDILSEMNTPNTKEKLARGE